MQIYKVSYVRLIIVSLLQTFTVERLASSIVGKSSKVAITCGFIGSNFKGILRMILEFLFSVDFSLV